MPKDTTTKEKPFSQFLKEDILPYTKRDKKRLKKQIKDYETMERGIKLMTEIYENY